MKVRAFTLIECLIALFILGISSLLLCQGYTQLMKLTNRTSMMNSSLSQQMANAESGLGKTDTNSTLLRKDEKMEITLMVVGYEVDSTNDQKIETKNVKSRAYDTDAKYKGDMNVYEVKAYNYDSNGKGGNPLPDEKKDGSDMRYIYFAKE